MKYYKPCRTLEEAQAMVREDDELSIDSREHCNEFSTYVMALIVEAFNPSEYPYVVWKEL